MLILTKYMVILLAFLAEMIVQHNANLTRHGDLKKNFHTNRLSTIKALLKLSFEIFIFVMSQLAEDHISFALEMSTLLIENKLSDFFLFLSFAFFFPPPRYLPSYFNYFGNYLMNIYKWFPLQEFTNWGSPNNCCL